MIKRNVREVENDSRQKDRRLPEHPTALLGTPMLRASFGTLTVKETDKEKMTYSRFAGFHHSILHKSEKYVDYTFDYIF